MVVGIDIDGTITRSPEFFALLSKSLIAEGHTVLIITYRPDSRSKIHNDLERMGIAYTELITRDGHLSPAEFVVWKAKICVVREVNILFEDMPDVAAAVEPPTVVMLPLTDSTRAFMADVPWSEPE